MNYNILCDKYATRHVYGYCPSWALKWEYRRKQILDELRSYAADIIALQVCIFRQKNTLKESLHSNANKKIERCFVNRRRCVYSSISCFEFCEPKTDLLVTVIIIE
jgi:hypothetical protein